MTDEEIVEAVRSGTHTLVPRPIGDRKWFVGCYGDADIAPDALVLILDLFDGTGEGEEMCGLMMGALTQEENPRPVAAPAKTTDKHEEAAKLLFDRCAWEFMNSMRKGNRDDSWFDLGEAIRRKWPSVDPDTHTEEEGS